MNDGDKSHVRVMGQLDPQRSGLLRRKVGEKRSRMGDGGRGRDGIRARQGVAVLHVRRRAGRNRAGLLIGTNAGLGTTQAPWITMRP